MRARDSRLLRLQRAIQATPVRDGILDRAFAHFAQTGELPEDDRVAYEVVQKALRGGADSGPDDEATLENFLRQARLVYSQRERPSESWPPSVRTLLFNEALFEAEPLRGIARAAIAAEVNLGGDVTNRAFASRHGIPGYGCVALHVFGYPRLLAVPPYEAQAQRLFVRLDNLRGLVPQDDPRWFEEQTKAMLAFRERGELPKDELQLETLLAHVELDLLTAHRGGQDVQLAMQVLDLIATGDGDARESSLMEFCELAKAGNL